MKDLIGGIKNRETVFYKNNLAEKNPEKYLSCLDFGIEDIRDAEGRMNRFAPVINSLFPETKGGIIESPFTETLRLR